jgi:hypothetical protein
MPNPAPKRAALSSTLYFDMCNAQVPCEADTESHGALPVSRVALLWGKSCFFVCPAWRVNPACVKQASPRPGEDNPNRKDVAGNGRV